MFGFISSRASEPNTLRKLTLSHDGVSKTVLLVPTISVVGRAVLVINGRFETVSSRKNLARLDERSGGELKKIENKINS